jgi:Calcineurin-like phosphoesterase
MFTIVLFCCNNGLSYWTSTMTTMKCRCAPKFLARRTHFFPGLIAACAILLSTISAGGQALTPAWVELGEDGKAIARIVVNGPQDCPAIQIDGASRAMSLRQPMPSGLRPLCEFAIPSGAKSASVNAHALALPKPDPARVIAIGDTGCRIKGRQIQACNDPALWPFRQVAASAASEKPELIVHVGDYLYRESPCPEASQAMCGGSPAGDNWEAWNADFFAPAAELLSASPWVFSRGNHEDCNRSWRGWFYYLDPRPWDGTCEEYSAPYLVKLGKFQLAILDSSATKERDLDEAQIAVFASQLAAVHPENAWLATHFPFWGFSTEGASGLPKPLAAVLEAAWEKSAPTGFTLILSGHVHLFEYVSVDHGRPPQVVAGDGGTQMSVPIQISMKGTEIRGASVIGSRSRQQFGYTMLTRDGSLWHLELKDQRQGVLVSCTVPGTSESCQSAGSE